MTNIALESSQDDLNIILEELLIKGKPSKQSLDQLEYDLKQLNKELSKGKNEDVAHNITQSINLIDRILKKYRQSTSPIRITRENKDRLHDLDATYDLAITTLLDFYDENH